jgi:ketosteroid isomerase-like protein
MNFVSRWPWLAAVWITLLLAGCGGGGGGDPSRFNSQITDAYALYAGAVEAEDIHSLMLLVSPDYLQDGTDYNGFEALFQSIFQKYDNLQMDVYVSDIKFNDNNHPDQATVQFEQRITGFNPASQKDEVIVDAPLEMLWQYEDSRWKMLGDQQRNPTAQSLQPDSIARHLGSKRSER